MVLSIRIPSESGPKTSLPSTSSVKGTPRLLKMAESKLKDLHEREKQAVEQYRKAVKEVKDIEAEYKTARSNVQRHISAGKKSDATKSLSTLKDLNNKLQSVYPKLLTAREESLAVRSILESKPARSHRQPVKLSGEPTKWTVPQLNYYSGSRLNKHLEDRVKTLKTQRAAQAAAKSATLSKRSLWAMTRTKSRRNRK